MRRRPVWRARVCMQAVHRLAVTGQRCSGRVAVGTWRRVPGIQRSQPAEAAAWQRAISMGRASGTIASSRARKWREKRRVRFGLNSNEEGGGGCARVVSLPLA